MALNVCSLLFWATHKQKKSWLVLISGLNLSDMLMAVYLSVLAITDIYYNMHYSAWSFDAWQGSWLCGLAMFCAQLSFQMSLWIVLLISVDRLMLTKFALSRHSLGSALTSVCILLGLIVNTVFSISNVYTTVTHDGRAPTLCLFISAGQHVPTLQWAIFAYNLSLVLALTCVNIASGMFFARRKRIKKHTSKQHSETKMVLRIAVTAATHFLSWLILGIIQACALLDGCFLSVELSTVQLITLVLNSVLNAVINTFSKAKFILFIQGLKKGSK
jgi:hypothetical protein